MNCLKSFGPLYVHLYKVRAKVRIRPTWTQEIEPPYRSGKCLLFTFPFRLALAVGVWTGKKSEYEGLMAAMGARDIGSVTDVA